jgi:type IV fimbrial biogenesis protein FimT
MLTPPARERGFSIVEILITLGIIALVIGLASPSVMLWIQNLQLRNAADSVLGGLQMARLEALKRNTTIAFEFQDQNSVAWHVCVFDVANAACKAGDIASAAGSSSGNARVGVETTYSDYALALGPGVNVPSLVAFDPFGRVSPNSPVNIARIDVRNPTLSSSDERRLSIRVEAAGEVHMCDPKLSKATNPQGCQ